MKGYYPLIYPTLAAEKISQSFPSYKCVTGESEKKGRQDGSPPPLTAGAHANNNTNCYDNTIAAECRMPEAESSPCPSFSCGSTIATCFSSSSSSSSCCSSFSSAPSASSYTIQKKHTNISNVTTDDNFDRTSITSMTSYESSFTSGSLQSPNTVHSPFSEKNEKDVDCANANNCVHAHLSKEKVDQLQYKHEEQSRGREGGDHADSAGNNNHNSVAQCNGEQEEEKDVTYPAHSFSWICTAVSDYNNFTSATLKGIMKSGSYKSLLKEEYLFDKAKRLLGSRGFNLFSPYPMPQPSSPSSCNSPTLNNNNSPYIGENNVNMSALFANRLLSYLSFLSNNGPHRLSMHFHDSDLHKLFALKSEEIFNFVEFFVDYRHPIVDSIYFCNESCNSNDYYNSTQNTHDNNKRSSSAVSSSSSSCSSSHVCENTLHNCANTSGHSSCPSSSSCGCSSGSSPSSSSHAAGGNDKRQPVCAAYEECKVNIVQDSASKSASNATLASNNVQHSETYNEGKTLLNKTATSNTADKNISNASNAIPLKKWTANNISNRIRLAVSLHPEELVKKRPDGMTDRNNITAFFGVCGGGGAGGRPAGTGGGAGAGNVFTKTENFCNASCGVCRGASSATSNTTASSCFSSSSTVLPSSFSFDVPCRSSFSSSPIPTTATSSIKQDNYNGGAGRGGGLNSMPHSKRLEKILYFGVAHQTPVITLRCYMERIMKYGAMEPHDAILSIVLLSRLLKANRELRFAPWNIHRFLLLACMVTTKVHLDKFYDSVMWARIGGISVHELNKLEVAFLQLLNYDLQVSLEEFCACYCLVKEALLAHNTKRNSTNNSSIGDKKNNYNSNNDDGDSNCNNNNDAVSKNKNLFDIERSIVILRRNKYVNLIIMGHMHNNSNNNNNNMCNKKNSNNTANTSTH